MTLLACRALYALLTAALCCCLVCPPAAAAQGEPGSVQQSAGKTTPAVPATTVERGPEGRVVVHAVPTAAPPTIDGALDEEIYLHTPPIDGFIQQEPREGQPAAERTEVWLLYDETKIYIGARCWTRDPGRIVANEMRRDGMAIFQNDNFGAFFDTFHDRRNGYFFFTNPLGAVSEQLISDERDVNRDWNTVWDVRASRFDGGWTVEMAIPFRSLRYPAPGPQTWGVQFRRVARGSNEISYLTAMPAAFTQRAITRASQAATLVGLEAPSAALNLELKPYSVASAETDLLSSSPFRNRASADFGLDAKYTFKNGLVADATVNTDFAQVEDDEQQVNLTRFDLFFPERRDFFLEGAGIFAFGGASVNPRQGGYGPPSNTPILFYSRRIGLYENEEGEASAVPIKAGGRVTGRTGAYTVGLLDIQQGEAASIGAPATNFSVIRVKRDLLAQSSIGAILTNRSRSAHGTGSSQTFGADAAFTFFRDLTINAYYAETRVDGRTSDASSYRADVLYMGDRYGFEVEHLAVGKNFDPESGFLRREDFLRNYAQARFSPRPAGSKTIRKYSFEASFDHFRDSAGQLTTQELQAQAGLEMQNGDEYRVEVRNSFEFLDDTFEIAPGVFLPAAGYRFTETEGSYRLGPQRRLNGFVTAGVGQFYDGSRRQVGYRGRVEISPRIGLEPAIAVNWVDLTVGSFISKLVTTRVNYNVSPRTALSALVQYNSQGRAIGANLRFRWEYRPGSDLFVVFNEGRDTTLGVRRAGVGTRTFAVKFTRLFRF